MRDILYLDHIQKKDLQGRRQGGRGHLDRDPTHGVADLPGQRNPPRALEARGERTHRGEGFLHTLPFPGFQSKSTFKRNVKLYPPLISDRILLSLFITWEVKGKHSDFVQTTLHLKDEFRILETPVLTAHLPASGSGSSPSPSGIQSPLNSPSSDP